MTAVNHPDSPPRVPAARAAAIRAVSSGRQVIQPAAGPYRRPLIRNQTTDAPAATQPDTLVQDSSDGEKRASQRRRIDLAIVLLLALVYTSLPSFIDIELGGRLPFAENSTGPVISTGLGDRARTLVTPLPYIAFLLVLIRNIGVGSRRIGTAVIFVALCAAISLASLISIGDATFAFREVAVVVATIWVISPKRADLVVFARFGVGIALISLALAGLGLNGWMATGAGAGKGIFTERLLAGPFAQMNVLGMALAVSLPLAALFATPLARLSGFVIIGTALLLTSSRTSLLAAGVAVAVLLVLLAVRGQARKWVAWTATGIAVAVIAILPVSTTDPEAFTDRGRIWITSLELLPGHWAFGLGISAYSVDGPVTISGDMPATWHGHNILITAVVMGGVVTAALLLLLFLIAMRNAVSHIAEQPAIVSCALTLLMIGLAETPVRIDTFDGAAWMTWTVFAALLFLPKLERTAEDQAGPAAEPVSAGGLRPNGSYAMPKRPKLSSVKAGPYFRHPEQLNAHRRLTNGRASDG